MKTKAMDLKQQLIMESSCYKERCQRPKLEKRK